MNDTNTFVVTYASGESSTMQSTCDSVEAFCNEHFGSTWVDAQAAGATVVMSNAPNADTDPEDTDPEEEQP